MFLAFSRANKKYLQAQPFTHNAKDLHYVAVLRAPRASINHRSRMFAMIRMPLATASLLAIAISLAGCGEGKDKAAAPQAPTPAASTAAPAAPAATGKVDEAAAKAVVAHYADIV